MEKINNIVRIPTKIENDFFKYWLYILRPIHNLSVREIDVAAEFLKKRFELQQSIVDNDNLLDSVVMNEKTKSEIRKNCNISSAHFQVVMGKLRKASFIKDSKINPKFIPKNLNKEDKKFQLLFYFDFDINRV